MTVEPVAVNVDASEIAPAARETDCPFVLTVFPNAMPPTPVVVICIPCVPFVPVVDSAPVKVVVPVPVV